jgi:transposase
MNEDTITMTMRDQRRAQLLTRVLAGTLTLREAAHVMGISLRQARRLKGAFDREGPVALVHGNRGRSSPRQTEAAIGQAVVEHYRTTYSGCNLQHFTELLAEREGIPLSVATVRRLLKAAGLGSPKTRRVPAHRARRERVAAAGMLLQLDASPFRWLGPDGPRWSLVSAVDDATSAPVAAVFREQEDAAGYMLLLREIVQTQGIPAAVYHDRHGIFQRSARQHSSLEEDLAGAPFPTQVSRLLAELGVASISAHSPQAKGRVERPWRTHQDRLVAELRLAGVQTLEEANAFLPGYLARYRTRFAVAPRSAESAYVPMGPETDLERLFCFKYTRKVAPDNTIRFAGQVLQIPPGPDRLSYARVVVEVHERLDQSLAVRYQGCQLLIVPAPTDSSAPLRARGQVTQRPELAALPQPLPDPAPVPVVASPRSRPKPAPDHPFRKSFKQLPNPTGGHFH